MKARLAAACVAVLGALAIQGTARAAECEGDPSAGAVQLVVRVAGVQSARGQVAVTLYPNIKRRFLAPGGKLLRVRTRAAAPVTTACFWVRPGAYAVAVYHDADGDHDYDRNAVGMPVEGFAFSNDPPTRFGLPSFESARFTVGAGGRTLPVQMRYLRAGDLSR
ncbi:DUF2141 domain-containing protein [Phenylobacterium sp.]|uniref:DUF2141 domain-containing protein n=1 Tax=Phenylobacterium sp. TaxID=1871053 RepID=UPI002BBD1E9B|nr:DUF2141 domain-containing protein [Phenylobacterium sp.]HVI32877.1 DUF2141 domain-containing protein [Phenylobacterium sp.]